MSYLLLPVAFAAGAWCEYQLDLSGRIVAICRKWQARRRQS